MAQITFYDALISAASDLIKAARYLDHAASVNPSEWAMIEDGLNNLGGDKLEMLAAKMEAIADALPVTVNVE